MLFNNKLKKYIKTLISNKDAEFDIEFTVDDYIFSKPAIKWKKYNGLLSKAGLLSWSGYLDKKKVKVVECFNKSQAEFIKYISNESSYKTYLPYCHMTINNYIVTDWVEGRQLDYKDFNNQNIIEKVAKFQVEMHSNTNSSNNHSNITQQNFGYENYLFNRFDKYKGILPVEKFVEQIKNDIDKYSWDDTQVLSHADITPSNIVIEHETNLVKIIDNELLFYSQRPLIDLFNTFYSLKSDVSTMSKYLITYNNIGGKLDDLIEKKDAYQAIWILREVGSKLQSGSMDKAVVLMDKYLQGDYNHPIFKITEDILSYNKSS